MVFALNAFSARAGDRSMYGLLAALAIWQIANASPEPPLWADQHCYMKLAESLASGNGYTTNGAPYTHAPPGWPVILAAAVKLFGDSEQAFVRVSIILGMAGIALAYRVLSRANGRAVAGLATLLVATSASYFTFIRHTAGSESAFTLFLFGALAAISRADEASSPKWPVLLAGLLAGAAILTRTAGIVQIGALCLWLATGGPRRPRRILVIIALSSAAAAVWFLYCFQNWGISSENTMSEALRAGTSPLMLAGRAQENLMAQMFDLTQVGLFDFVRDWYSPFWILPFAGLTASFVSAIRARTMSLTDWVIMLWIGIFMLFLSAGGRYSIPVLPILYVNCWRGWNYLLRGGWRRRDFMQTAIPVVLVFMALFYVAGHPRPSARPLREWLFCILAALLLYGVARWMRRGEVHFSSGPSRIAAILAVVVCAAGFGQQVRLAAAGQPEDQGWNAMVRMTDWIKRNLASSDPVIVQDGLDCVVARLTSNPSYSWADGLNGAEEERILQIDRVRYVFKIKFTGEQDDAAKIALLLNRNPELLRPVYDGPDFEVLRVENQ